jgi:hypothetical protein
MHVKAEHTALSCIVLEPSRRLWTWTRLFCLVLCGTSILLLQFGDWRFFYKTYSLLCLPFLYDWPVLGRFSKRHQEVAKSFVMSVGLFVQNFVNPTYKTYSPLCLPFLYDWPVLGRFSKRHREVAKSFVMSVGQFVQNFVNPTWWCTWNFVLVARNGFC